MFQTCSKNTGNGVMPHQDVSALIPGTCHYIRLPGLRDFEDVIKLRILGEGDYSPLSQSVQCNYKGPYKREEEGSELIAKEERIEAKDQDDVRKGPPDKECRWPLRGENGNKQRAKFSPQSCQEPALPARTLAQ